MHFGVMTPSLSGTRYEAVYFSAYNNHSAAISAGSHVCYDPAATTAQFLGRAITRPATANLKLYAGVAATDFGLITATGQNNANPWGLVLCYGVYELALVDGGTTDIAVGDTLIVANGTFYANQPAAGTQGTGWIIAMEIQTSTSVTCRCLIRAM